MDDTTKTERPPWCAMLLLQEIKISAPFTGMAVLLMRLQLGSRHECSRTIPTPEGRSGRGGGFLETPPTTTTTTTDTVHSLLVSIQVGCRADHSVTYITRCTAAFVFCRCVLLHFRGTGERFPANFTPMRACSVVVGALFFHVDVQQGGVGERAVAACALV